MNLRQAAYFALVGLRGQRLGAYYRHILREDRDGIPPDTTRNLLVRLLAHCKRSVPYYAEIMRDLGDSFYDDPEEYLKRFPVLTKGIIRSRLDELKSTDLPRRKWYFNTSGGSTGEPVRFIQDWDYAARSGAITLLYSRLVGSEVGESKVQIWDSWRDITGATETWRSRFITSLTNTTLLSVFRLTPDKMREFVHIIDTRRPKLILAYPQAIYDLARFAEREGLPMSPQAAIIVSGGTLYPYMREPIERVFQCRVFDRYGSREVGDIACERPGRPGLWVAPWGNYLEIVDGDGNRVADGCSGEILVTSLTNFAMPLVRYRIEDRGVLSPVRSNGGDRHGQVLEAVLGRSYDMFVNRHGVLVESGQFMELLYFKDWVSKYQVIQRSYTHVEFRIVKTDLDLQPAELEEISTRTRVIMGDEVDVTFEFVDDIAASGSGKYRFIRSEIAREALPFANARE